MEIIDFIDTIIQGDCLQVLKELPDESIDYCIADFPYNISIYENTITKMGNNFVKGDFGEWDKWDNMEEYLNWAFEVSSLIQKKLKPLASCLFFFDNKQAGWIAYELERRSVFVYKSPIIWVKSNPVPLLRKTGFRSTFEHGVWLINSQEKYIGNPKIVIKSKTFNFQEQEEMMNVMKYSIGNKETKHPTEKPISLTARFIEIFTNENDIVLDPFLGSGTTAVAAKRLNRHYIGIEIDPQYVKMARERLNFELLDFG